jgi:hypothetical protein
MTGALERLELLSLSKLPWFGLMWFVFFASMCLSDSIFAGPYFVIVPWVVV